MKQARRKRKSRRLFVLAGAGALLGLAVALVLSALNDDIVFFRSPSDILSEAANGNGGSKGNGLEGQQLRLGGLVGEGSVTRSPDGLQVSFLVTDGANAIPVSYHGILPDLFREGQGVIVDGMMRGDIFAAATVLAKHDENYMPREVQAALDQGELINARAAAMAE